MSIYTSFAGELKTNKPIPEEYKIKVEATPIPLMKSGFNIPITITPSSMVREMAPDKAMKSITIMAHFDTGASKTNIDTHIAEILGLSAVGVSKAHTAAGLTQTSEYAIDLSFPGIGLHPFKNLRVGSCKLPFDPDQSRSGFLSNNNFGALIGRDIMSRWNITWNGPTSTVFISD